MAELQTPNALALQKRQHSAVCQRLVIKRAGLFLLNPFLPTGQFLAPKLIISIKCLIDILFL